MIENTRTCEASSFRHEFKYLISDAQITCLQQQLNPIMHLDSHAGANGFYSISSLYFDDYFNRCLYDNINGVDPREKYRIRIYNANPEHMTLECKRKENGMTQKRSTVLTRELYDMLVKGNVPLNLQEQHLVVQKLTCEILLRQMKPVIIVSYDRIPYVCEAGNVRITIDRNLSSSTQTALFLSGKFARRPVMPSGMSLLEVKWDHFIPDDIFHAVQIKNLFRTTYSKYALCRQYKI
ncbi:MAG: polyphosphate polymerase domain-containing protein [Clostridia bacterium]|nr:polyphosphate polymerase domain-containing protein [Clostridia bacterium]